MYLIDSQEKIDNKWRYDLTFRAVPSGITMLFLECKIIV